MAPKRASKPMVFRMASSGDFSKRALFGFRKGVFWKRGLLEEVHLEILEILENLQTVENKGEADHLLEILENLETLEIPPAKRPLS